MKLAFYEDYILVLKKKKEEARRTKDEYVYKFKELIPYTHITALYRDVSTSNSTYFCIICEVSTYYPVVIRLNYRAEHEKFYSIFGICNHKTLCFNRVIIVENRRNF